MIHALQSNLVVQICIMWFALRLLPSEGALLIIKDLWFLIDLDPGPWAGVKYLVILLTDWHWLTAEGGLYERYSGFDNVEDLEC